MDLISLSTLIVSLITLALIAHGKFKIVERPPVESWKPAGRNLGQLLAAEPFLTKEERREMISARKVSAEVVSEQYKRNASVLIPPNPAAQTDQVDWQSTVGKRIHDHTRVD
jgi:hypothetical protein